MHPHSSLKNIQSRTNPLLIPFIFIYFYFFLKPKERFGVYDRKKKKNKSLYIFTKYYHKSYKTDASLVFVKILSSNIMPTFHLWIN